METKESIQKLIEKQKIKYLEEMDEFNKIILPHSDILVSEINKMNTKHEQTSDIVKQLAGQKLKKQKAQLIIQFKPITVSDAVMPFMPRFDMMGRPLK